MALRILYSHNKTGIEAQHWDAELRNASDDRFEFIPFNHGPYAPLFANAGDLDLAYRRDHAGLRRLYADVESLIRAQRIDVLFVTNAPQYHPEFLQKLAVYRVLYSTDDQEATYRRTIPYLHAYDHVLFCTPLHNAEKGMEQKMRECGMRNADWLPLGVFDFEFDSKASEEEVFSTPRDIDVVYVGGCFLHKLPLLARVQRALGRQLRLHGFFKWKHNAYFIVRHGARTWVTPVSYEERVRLYRRAKIGFNIHWDNFTLGNQRLYHLPANGVMEISDCARDLGQIYAPGSEIVGYESADDLIDRIRHYLAHDDERLAIARAGYHRTMQDYRIGRVTRQAGKLIERGMTKLRSDVP